MLNFFHNKKRVISGFIVEIFECAGRGALAKKTPGHGCRGRRIQAEGLEETGSHQ